MKVFVFSATLALMAGPIAFATTTDELTLNTGALAVTILDNGSCFGTACGTITTDTDPSAGLISISGTIGGWTINISGTTTSPSDSSCIGNAACGLNLTTTNISTTFASDPLHVLYSDINFTTPASTFGVTYSGFITGTGVTSQSAYYSNTNTLFDETSLVGTIGPFAATFNSSLCCSTAALVFPYSLTLDQVFVSGGSGVTFDPQGQITATPEPASLGLLGAVLAMCVVCLRRRSAGKVPEQSA